MLKILHYVEKSFENKPSFVILMSDQKEYISNGCVWIENTKENIQYLIDRYNCEQYLDELFLSSININEIRNTRYMFYNSNITEFEHDMPNVTNANSMFVDTNLTTFNSNMSNVINADSMFYNTNLTTFDSDMPNVKYADFMFAHTNLTTFNSDMNNVIDNYNMFDNTPYNSNK